MKEMLRCFHRTNSCTNLDFMFCQLWSATMARRHGCYHSSRFWLCWRQCTATKPTLCGLWGYVEMAKRTCSNMWSLFSECCTVRFNNDKNDYSDDGKIQQLLNQSTWVQIDKKLAYYSKTYRGQKLSPVPSDHSQSISYGKRFGIKTSIRVTTVCRTKTWWIRGSSQYYKIVF